MLSKPLIIITSLIFLCKSTICQDCNDLLKYGIYDYEKTNIERSRATWYVYKFIQDNFQSYEQAKSMDASATIPIDDVLVTLGFGTNESGFSQLKTYMEKYFSLQTEERYKLEKTTNKINPQILNAWTACRGQPGPHFYIIYTEDPKVFKLYGYVAYQGGSYPKIQSGGFDHPERFKLTTEGRFLD
jgi:hypothetical protein